MKLKETLHRGLLFWFCDCELAFCVSQVDNKDVLRAVVALYDVSLPDIGASDILDTVQCSGAHTIVLLRSSKGTRLDRSRVL